ncbi:MAG: glycosyltransferase family 2 protein [Syntrophales bacterium]|jgi:glycosyltransferase involved in cell wall biosynthesis|nr:glycosyltransferase family 2 protein [Syntrophales bacterium]MCK9528804.1 glycosyltransferase family 2 protein [Syntrophales bacterium]MDX9922751.1 glycosyltransferase family 2 protein [Syntrophales bacterium]
MPEISVIIPACREEAVIGSVVATVRAVLDGAGRSHEIIVVDDGSGDGTADAARDAGARVISHPYNIGNGAAVKTGIRHAAGEIIVTMDGDGQHDPHDIPRLLEPLGRYDMVVAARTSDSESSFHRRLANAFYNLFASYICKRPIKDLTSGFRAIQGDIARGFVSLLPNTFSYPTTITMAMVRAGHSLAYVPIEARRRVGNSKIKLVRDGSRFLLIIVKIATLYSPLRIFLPVSAIMFLTGVGYGLFRIVFMGGRYGPTSAMLITMSVVVFMVGLVSEQITQLRYDRSAGRE